jgi:hypothetical protein
LLQLYTERHSSSSSSSPSLITRQHQSLRLGGKNVTVKVRRARQMAARVTKILPAMRPFRASRAENLRRSCVSQHSHLVAFDLIARPYGKRETRNAKRALAHLLVGSTICFLHAPCHDYLADEHTVHASDVYARTHRLDEEGKGRRRRRGQGVEEERKAHTRARLVPVTAVHTARRGPV